MASKQLYRQCTFLVRVLGLEILPFPNLQLDITRNAHILSFITSQAMIRMSAHIHSLSLCEAAGLNQGRPEPVQEAVIVDSPGVCKINIVSDLCKVSVISPHLLALHLLSGDSVKMPEY